jgi:hypothetical protein
LSYQGLAGGRKQCKTFKTKDCKTTTTGKKLLLKNKKSEQSSFLKNEQQQNKTVNDSLINVGIIYGFKTAGSFSGSRQKPIKLLPFPSQDLALSTL